MYKKIVLLTAIASFLLPQLSFANSLHKANDQAKAEQHTDKRASYHSHSKGHKAKCSCDKLKGAAKKRCHAKKHKKDKKHKARKKYKKGY